MTTNPSCAQETVQLGEEYLHGIMKEGEYQDYIESWFLEVNQPQYNSFPQHLLMQKHVSWLVLHI